LWLVHFWPRTGWRGCRHFGLCGGEGFSIWAQRRGKSFSHEAPTGKPMPLIARIHRLMHRCLPGDVHSVDEFLDEHGLRRHEWFKSLLQSILELSKAGGEECSLLESLSNHLGIFADTAYFLALLNPQDGWHQPANGA
jgi:hypothetical protein